MIHNGKSTRMEAYFANDTLLYVELAREHMPMNIYFHTECVLYCDHLPLYEI